jgi:Ferritin-like domain
MRTRRELLAGGIGLAAGGTLGAALPALAGADTTTKPIPSDAQLMQTLLSVEQLIVFVYERALGSGELAPRTARLTRELLAHERDHVRAVAARLPPLGIAAPRAPRNDAEAEQALKTHHTVVRFSRHRSDHEWIGVMMGVEDVLERNYHQALSELRHPALLRLAAEILASEAQHTVLLDVLRNPHSAKKALPSPFINGG